MKAVALLAAVAAAAAVALVVQQRASARDEARLGRVASEIARRPVAVRCQGVVAALLDVGATAGTVGFDAAGRPADETHLTRDVCRALRRLARDADGPGLDCVRARRACPPRAFALVQATHTLAHESWHLAGVRDEAQAECYALQTTALVAERLGVAPPTARAIGAYAAARLLPSLPQRYRTDACREDGPLDLAPGTPSFP